MKGDPTRQCCMGFSASRSRTSSMSVALLCGVKCGGRLNCAASCRFCSTVNEPSRASSLGASLTRFAYSLVEAGSLLYCTLPAAHLLSSFKRRSNEYLHCTVYNVDWHCPQKQGCLQMTFHQKLVNQLQHNEFAGGRMLGVTSSAIDIRSRV